MNCPMMSGQYINGQNAASVVNVEVVTGQATSAAPSRAACNRLFPSQK